MLFIFDWDGTLSDSTRTIIGAMRQSAQDLGLTPPTPEAVQNIIGLGMPEALAELFPGLSDSERDRVRRRYSENYLAADLAQPSRLFPTVMETLTHLREAGHHLAVATGKSRKGLDRVLKVMGLNGFFHASRCADETTSKPHPLMLTQLLEYFRVPSAEAVMIGDTEYDMEMGRRARMARIAVTYGAHAIERLEPFEPALCLDRFDELLDWERLVPSRARP